MNDLHHPVVVPAMAVVLVVGDDPVVRAALIRDLTARDWVVRSVGTALDSLREVSEHPPDVIILGLGLPDLDGGETLTMIRGVSDVPTIVATARDDETEIVRLLRADDDLVKPFSSEHLNARVEAVLRRARGAQRTPVITVGGLRVDVESREATLDGTELELARREFDLLAYLASRPGRVVPRRELLSQVWRQAFGDDQTIDVHLSWLRRKLGESAAEPRYLHTVRGVAGQARGTGMRRTVVLVALAVTSMVALAFLVPLGLVVREMARDQAMSDAERQAVALAPVLATTEDEGLVGEAVASTRAGQLGQVAVHLPDGAAGGTSRAGTGEVR